MSDLASKVSDVQLASTSIVNNGVANIPLASSGVLGVCKQNGMGVSFNANGDVYISTAESALVKAGSNVYKPITPSNQHNSVFYGLAKAAGDSTQSASTYSVGTYTPEAQSAIQNMLGIQNNVLWQ